MKTRPTETLQSIIAEMRKSWRDDDYVFGDELHEYADRLEAALLREAAAQGGE